MGLRYRSAVAALAAGTVLGIVTAGGAQAAPLHRIIGGERAPVSRSVVYIDLGTRCTGSQLNDRWVLTAAHCVPGSSTGRPRAVYQTNNLTDLGAPRLVAATYTAPQGDLALIQLTEPAPNVEYARLNYEATPASVGTGTVKGFGARAFDAPADGLYQASVALTGPTTDLANAVAQRVQGTNGSPNSGDSGGPLIVDGVQVGVASSITGFNPTAVNGVANYALISTAANWIRPTAETGAVPPVAPPPPPAPAPPSPFGS